MSTLIKTFPALAVTAGTRVPVGAAILANLTLAFAGVSAKTATVKFTTAHGVTALKGQVTFFGVGTNTFLNGQTVSVTAIPDAKTIEFSTTNADVAYVAETGSAIVNALDQRYRVLRLELDEDASTGAIYVGDNQVSSEQYSAKLTLAGQAAFELVGEGIDPSRVWVDTSASTTKVQVSVIL